MMRSSCAWRLELGEVSQGWISVRALSLAECRRTTLIPYRVPDMAGTLTTCTLSQPADCGARMTITSPLGPLSVTGHFDHLLLLTLAFLYLNCTVDAAALKTFLPSSPSASFLFYPV
jgi:hypothetical protein